MSVDNPTKDELARALRISSEIYAADGKVEEALRAKCNWEHMTRMAVILEWGDPREWDLE